MNGQQAGAFPTPLQRMTGLESLFSEPPELYVKREDLCGIGAGGNKARKLSALLTEAAAGQATVVITSGAVQSNHCAMTAVAAVVRGLRAELYLTGDDPGSRTGNLRVDEAAGATITFLGACAEHERDDRVAARVRELRAAGEVPYLIPFGGSAPSGAAACAAAVTELAGQTGGRTVTHLVVAAGSLGTVAGLILGTWATGMHCDVHGYTVLWPEEEAAARLDDLLTVTREHHLPGLAARPNYRILGTQRGSGYGMATQSSREAARIAIRQDGLILDQAYTAKAMAGLIQGIRDGTYTRRDKVVFFHTGGLAGFFAEDDKELA